MNYSYTKMADYSTCPAYFKERYIERRRVLENEDLVIGKASHEALCKYALKCYEANRTNLFDSHVAILDEVLRGYSLTSAQDDAIRAMFREYVQANEIELDGLAGVEEKIAIDADFNEVEWLAENVWFRGVLDIYYLVGDVAIVRDYKTGFSLSPDLFQLEVYAWLIMNLYPNISKVIAEADFVRFCTRKQLEIPRSALPGIDRKVRNRIRQIEEDTRYRPVANNRCSSCPFWGSCEEIQRVGINNVVALPVRDLEAQELLSTIILLERKLKEHKEVLRSYCEDVGFVQQADVKAQIKLVEKKLWNTEALFNEAVAQGVPMVGALSVNPKKLNRVFPANFDFTPFYTIKRETRFTIGKVREEGEESEEISE